MSRAQAVLACYRRDDFADAEGFVLQLGMAMEKYPDAIILDATSPITGIARSCKFPPTISEMVEMCEYLSERAERLKKYAEMGPAKIRSRKPGPPPGESYEDMFAKHGRPFGVFEKDRKLVYRG